MADDQQDPEPTQQTQPKGIDPKTGEPYEPVEIPVPTRSTWETMLGRATSAGEHRATDKEAVIEAALQRLRRHYETARRDAPDELAGLAELDDFDVLSTVTLVSARARGGKPTGMGRRGPERSGASAPFRRAVNRQGADRRRRIDIAPGGNRTHDTRLKGRCSLDWPLARASPLTTELRALARRAREGGQSSPAVGHRASQRSIPVTGQDAKSRHHCRH